MIPALSRGQFCVKHLFQKALAAFALRKGILHESDDETGFGTSLSMLGLNNTGDSVSLVAPDKTVVDVLAC
jgi:hypothetical protein